MPPARTLLPPVCPFPAQGFHTDTNVCPESGDGQLTGNLISPTDERARWKLHRRNNGAYEYVYLLRSNYLVPGKTV